MYNLKPSICHLLLFAMVPMEKNPSIVLISGGLDSCVAAAIACQENEVSFLHVNYGQKTEERELKAFNDIADYYRIKRRLVADISYLKKIGGSSLTDKNIEIEDYLENRAGIPATYVPFRNTHFLSIATSWAEVIGAHAIFIGAVEQASSGYPDCRAAYFESFNRLIEKGTKPETHIAIETPLISLKKKDIVLKGTHLNAPLHLTWSCYRRNGKACGTCDSCRLRLKGFEEAGLQDPIVYEEPF